MNKETNGALPVAYISNESLRNLRRGGNDSKGTVPVHSKRSCISTTGLYLHPQPDQSARIAELEAALRRIIASDDAHHTIHAADGDDVARMVEYAEAFDAARAALAKAKP